MVNGTCVKGKWTYPHEPAKNAEKALATIQTQLSKLGDSPYIAREVRIESKPYFIPISILNNWRREVLSQPIEFNSVSGLTAQRSNSDSCPTSNSVSVPTAGQHVPLMTCKYCLLFELNHCRKSNPYPHGQEPQYLRLKTGKTLRLSFDCKQCQMTIDEC